MPPLSLYVHFPYCVQKCPYCDFASTATAEVPEGPYLAALLRELRYWRQRLADDPRPLLSIFMGGGTPSLFSPQAIATLLAAIRADWSLTGDCEITLEANPESATPPRLAGYRQAGVNRLSLGIQALDQARLRQLCRPHGLATALQAVAAAQQTGFPELNLDLIYATPHHTPDLWAAELRTALDLHPTHLSCYALTLEAGTPFHEQYTRGQLIPPDEETELALFRHTRAWLGHKGLPPYEISNFSLPGHPCRHNLNYWQFGDYLGLGAGAHGKLSEASGATRRTTNPRDATAYIAARKNEETLLTPEEAAAEWLIMGLRTSHGVNPAHYTHYAGASLWQRRGPQITRFVSHGLLLLEGERLALTEEGVRLANMVLAELI